MKKISGKRLRRERVRATHQRLRDDWFDYAIDCFFDGKFILGFTYWLHPQMGARKK